MNISNNCVNIIKQFEGFSATVYKDIVGVPTLGYGLTGTLIGGLTKVTESQATDLLKQALNTWVIPINKALMSGQCWLNQNQFDAIVSLSYNIGVTGLLSSTLFTNLLRGVRDRATITNNFLMWNKAGGKVEIGLTNRRTQEAELFLKGVVTMAKPVTNVDQNILQLQQICYILKINDHDGNVVKCDGVDGQHTQEAQAKLKAFLVNILK